MIGDDVEMVARVIDLKPITAIADQEIEVRLPLELGPASYITSYRVDREGDTVIMRVWSGNLGTLKDDAA